MIDVFFGTGGEKKGFKHRHCRYRECEAKGSVFRKELATMLLGNVLASSGNSGGMFSVGVW